MVIIGTKLRRMVRWPILMFLFLKFILEREHARREEQRERGKQSLC